MKITNRRQFSLFLLTLALLVCAVLYFLWGGATIQRSGEVEIVRGDAAQQVWRKMVERKFTARTLPWRYYALRANAAGNLKAGRYQIEKGEAVRAVIARIVEGEILPNEISLTYPEGFTLEQIAARTAERGIGTAEAFLATALPSRFADEFVFLKEVPAGRSLEGYLFPDTYRVFADDTPEEVLQRMLANFNQKITDDLRIEAASAGRTLDQIVVMASILEREVINEDDMAVVSGLLWKRYDEQIGLDADATVRYAVKNWDNPLTVDELRVDSPYNTRRYRGLPPGPISNPGLRALIAAVRPQTTDFYYYLSAPDGKTIFSKTNDEHNQNKAKYLN